MTTDVELPFRVAFGFFWLGTMIVRIFFQSRARGTVIDVAVHERKARLYFRLLASMYLVMPVYILTPWLDFAALPLPAIMRWILGGGLLIAYTILFIGAHAALGKHWSGLLEIHKDHALIVSGPYSYIRHPMYAAFFLSGLGFLFLSANVIAGGLYLIVAIAMYIDRVKPEEQMMEERFGDDYSRYRERTGRIIPRLRKK